MNKKPTRQKKELELLKAQKKNIELKRIYSAFFVLLAWVIIPMISILLESIGIDNEVVVIIMVILASIGGLLIGPISLIALIIYSLKKRNINKKIITLEENK